MKFCAVCDNMYYLTLDETDANKLTYKCRRCGHAEETVHESVCVLKTQLKNSQHQYQHLINEFTKLDPTLPRLRTLKCPGSACPTNHPDAKEPAEIVFKRYDDDRMKYIYVCTTCSTSWKTDDCVRP